MMTFEELHKKTLPEHKKAAVKIDFVSYYLWRPICDFLSILLMGKIEATTVTILSFYACIISLACFSLKIGIAGVLLGYFFLWVWNIADGIDGNIARYTDTCSKSGDLWDAVAGYSSREMNPLPMASSQTSSTAEGVNSTLYRKATAPRTPACLAAMKRQPPASSTAPSSNREKALRGSVLSCLRLW